MTLSNHSDITAGDFAEVPAEQQFSVVEKIHYYENERNVLLAFNNQMAKVRTRAELQKLMNQELRKILNYCQAGILIVSDDLESVYPFLNEIDLRVKRNTQFNRLFNSIQSFNNGIYDRIVNSTDPMIFDFKQIIGKPGAPDFATVKYQAGIAESITTTLNLGEQRRGILIFDSENHCAYRKENVSLILALANSFSATVAQILANEELIKREQEKSTLLELNNNIARIRNKEDLLHIIRNDLRNLFSTVGFVIGLINEDTNTHSIYLIDHEEIAANYPGFKEIKTDTFQVEDGLFNKVLNSGEPMVFKLGELLSQPDAPVYIQFWRQMGLDSIMGTNLRAGDKLIGVLWLQPGLINNNIIRGVSAQFAIAISNILFNEEIHRRDHEKSVLLGISKDMASIRNKKDLLNVINSKLKKLISFSHSIILMSDGEDEVYRGFIVDPNSKAKDHPDYHNSAFVTAYPQNSTLLSGAFHSGEPQIIDVEEYVKEPDALSGVVLNHQIGCREILMHILWSEGKPRYALALFSDLKNGFDNTAIQIIKGLSFQMATAIENIRANEIIIGREREKSLLLTISNDITQIRDRIDLLAMINNRLTSLCHFTHCLIARVNKKQDAYIAFLVDPKSKMANSAKHKYAVTTDFRFDSKAWQTVAKGNGPVVLNLEEAVKDKDCPTFMRLNYELGLKEIVVTILKGEKGHIGSLILFSDIENGFTQNFLDILQGISSQVSVAIANTLANENIEEKEREKTILLSFSNDITRVTDREGLKKIIRHYLTETFKINDFIITTIDNDVQTYRYFMHNLPVDDTEEWVKVISGPSHAIEGSITEIVLASNKEVTFDVEELINDPVRPFPSRSFWQSTNTKEITGIILKSGGNDTGVLWMKSGYENKRLLNGICAQIAIALANMLANENIVRREEEKTILLRFSNAIAAVKSKEDLSIAIDSTLKGLFLIKDYIIKILNADETAKTYLFDPQAFFSKEPEFELLTNKNSTIYDGVSDKILESETPVILDVDDLMKMKNVPAYASFWNKLGIKTIVGSVLRVRDENIGIIFFEPLQLNINLLKGICSQISIAMSNILSNERIKQQLIEINNYREQLEEENLYLQEQVEHKYNYSELVGSGPEMQKVFHLISQVAPSNSTVLILGETGTGKELIARAIHNASPRKDKLMIKVNCAALPANLIESELFGHERGSFTGATERRIGKFELANNGTLFLDEIGEMPLGLQVKLLRALQEREIERVGGKETIKVNVRIIAATNRNLQKEVADFKFRSDLYYRLNVFPITLPSLRERKEDIPVLAAHFIERYAKSSGKKIHNISRQAQDELTNYDWPGNVRELEHLIERSILLTPGTTLKEIYLPVSTIETTAKKVAEDDVIKTIDENERDHIIKVLNKCNGKISGYGGAAAHLGVPPSTLSSKMAKLQITKEQVLTKSK